MKVTKTKMSLGVGILVAAGLVAVSTAEVEGTSPAIEQSVSADQELWAAIDGGSFATIHRGASEDVSADTSALADQALWADIDGGSFAAANGGNSEDVSEEASALADQELWAVIDWGSFETANRGDVASVAPESRPHDAVSLVTDGSIWAGIDWGSFAVVVDAPEEALPSVDDSDQDEVPYGLDMVDVEWPG